MSKQGSRLDRLVVLLETGSNNLIRNTAAQQLADLQRDHPDELFNFLARVVPFLRSSKWDTRHAAAKAIAGIVDNTAKFDPNEDEGTEVKIEDEAAIKGENGTTSDDGAKFPVTDDRLRLRDLDLATIIENGQKLVGSGGKQYDFALAGMNPTQRLATQKKSLNARLGLAGEYLEEDYLPDVVTVPTAGKPGSIGGGPPGLGRVDTSNGGLGRINTGVTQSPMEMVSAPGRSASMSEENGGMSKRQLNQLKRKAKAEAKASSRKVRVIDLSGPRSMSIDRTASPAVETPHPGVKQEDTGDIKSELFTTERAGPDDDSKVVSEFRGDIVPEKPAIQTEAEEEGLEWPFEKLCDILMVDLFDADWEIRHGAALGLKEIIRAHGAGAGRRSGKTRGENDALNKAWLDNLACRYCCVLMLDRFGDYISDTVVAPIRETVGQALATLLIHLPIETLDDVYTVLHRMVMQTDLNTKRRVWEVCHGGMLGLRYLGAVRKDVLMKHLDGIVEASNQGLTDVDDDVRAVGAATLVPIAEDLVRLRPNLLRPLMNTIWDCLAEIRDDLSASTGSIMDLLAKMSNYDEVLQAMRENAQAEVDEEGVGEHSFERLVPRLYPFLRHTIASVRSAVLRALQTFLQIDGPSTKSWVDARTLRLIFQNVLVERYEEPLELSFQLWKSLTSLLYSQQRFAHEFDQHADQLLTLALHPIGVLRSNIPMDYTLIMKSSGHFLAEPAIPTQRKMSPHNGEELTKKKRRRSEKKDEQPSKMHNVDGHMLQGDVELVGYDVLMRSRLFAARAFGQALFLEKNAGMQQDLLQRLEKALDSEYSTTQMSAAFIIEEFVRASDNVPQIPSTVLVKLQKMVDEDRPTYYSDLVTYLQVARSQCQNLLNAFRDQGRVVPGKIPTIAVVVQGDVGAGPNAFGIAEAEKIVNEDYDRLFSKGMSTIQRMTARKPLEEAREAVRAAIVEFNKHKIERDIRVRSAAAAALVALEHVPKKASKLIRGLMDSVKTEELFQLQKRSATAVASLIEYYVTKAASRGPVDKVIANLAKFYCIDTSDTPDFPANADLRDVILSLRKEEDRKEHQDAAEYEAEARAARIARRGAKEALDQLNAMFGKDLFTQAPSLKEQIEGPLIEILKPGEPDIGAVELERGQKVVDAFSIMRVLIPSMHPDLYGFIESMMPHILTGLRCNYAVFRYAAAKCFAAICSQLTVKGMTVLVEKVLPTINNPLNVHHRQGAIETAYHLIHLMEDRILPYVVFLIVPILGRMSDSNQDVRLIATTAFATLVKLVPLEAGISDPPGFSEELLKGRDRERKFVAQMLDPKKTEPFEIPVAIKAKLRSYQQEGVNWLAFLNRFNLHGVLCDDMGLGKTLQTLCIVASDHHIRAEEYAKTQDPAMRKMPSLIVCPPTLSGHWMQEVATYAPFLNAVAYVGPPAERAKVRPRMGSSDIVVTSYDVCRNDIESFASLDWNYCVLDEGHLIKNPKAKTSLAVKRLNSNHRLILSGTPIQNNVLELWSLFDFLMPGFLGTEKVFHERFAKPIAASRNAKSSSKEQEKGALAIESLHKQVLPFLLRRLKEEVLEDLPPKIIQNYYCDLSDLQKKLFEDFAKKEKKSIEATAGSKTTEAKQHIFQALQYMRKLCNSPSLVVKPGHKQYDLIQQQLATKKSNLHDINHAPKLLALKDLLVDCGIGAPPPAEGELGTQENYVSPHRALIFCQMKEMLDIVQENVLRKLLPSVQYLRLDGSVEANSRQSIVNRFNTDPSYDVLLLTTSVGGLGLNLTGADTVIFVEHDWNPQKDMQAMDRAHRIGQKKVVNVYRLITRGTLEEKILNLQRFKMDVASTVVNQQNAGLGSMQTDQLLDLFDLDTSSDSGVPKLAADNEAGVVDVGASGREEDAVDVATGEIREKGKGGVLDGLQELWDESQYKEEYDLDEFLKTMKV